MPDLNELCDDLAAEHAALDLLLEANLQLVSTQLDDRLILEELVAKVCRRPAAAKANSSP